MRVGFVGATGLMGHGMARNIVTKGFELAFTLRRDGDDRVADLLEAGATRAADNVELGRTCDVIVICVTSSADVEAIVADLLAEAKPGLVIVDSSTAEPASTRWLAEAALEQGVGYVDAPLTLGPQQAEEGTLNVIVGADDEQFEVVRPVIETFAGRVIRSGGVGTAHTLKLINNFVFQAMCNAVAEGFGVAAKAGLDPALVEDILGVGTMDNALIHNLAKTLHGDYEAMTFQLDNARKDLRYYQRMTSDLGYVASLGDATHTALELASAQGFGGEYVPSIVKSQARLNGVEITTGRVSG